MRCIVFFSFTSIIKFPVTPYNIEYTIYACLVIIEVRPHCQIYLLVYRIYLFLEQLQHLIKLVRIGPESSISKAVVGYSLPKLAEKHVPLRNIEIPEMKVNCMQTDDELVINRSF